MNEFGEYNDQDLGKDFVFESDPYSLQRILNNRELSPRSVLAMRITPTISPAKGASKHVRNNPNKFDFFESKAGDIFCRPKNIGSSSSRNQQQNQQQGQYSQGG